jgi:hypothetical protein
MNPRKAVSDELIRQHGDTLRGMTHAEYVRLASAACLPGPALDSALRLAKEDPERRFTNVICYRVLRYLHQQATGIGAEVDTGGLELF